MNQQYGQYSVRPGPEAFLPPAAASMGVVLPDPGQAHINGRIVPEEEAFEEAARMFLGGTVPTIFPGPLVLWAWNEKAKKKAKAIKFLYDTLKECAPQDAKPMLIPMPDYRPSIRRSTRKWRLIRIIRTSPSGTTRSMSACSWESTATKPTFPSRSSGAGRTVTRSRCALRPVTRTPACRFETPRSKRSCIWRSG